MRRLFNAIIAGGFLLLGLATLGGCGQIGPLYLPESEPESGSVSEPETPVVTAPATEPVPVQIKPEQPVQAE